MAVKYEGWKVPDNIIIVAKDNRQWVDGAWVCEGTPQGYVVSPDNKEMLENALTWAKWTEYNGEYDTKTRRYAEQIDHVGKVCEFVNEGFTLTLLDSAAGSSQGGKLSFWNCKISKDSNEFIIGIASDYLLEILLHNTFVNGVCQTTLSFARCRSGVGMLTKTMPSYQQFLRDEQHRANMKKSKTKKREPGHLYSTLTGGDVYFSTFYRWYEPIYREGSRHSWYPDLIGFKKLSTPIAMYWQPWYDEDFTKKSEYFARSFYLGNSTPARIDSGIVAEIDVTDEEILSSYIDSLITAVCENSCSLSAYKDHIGLSTSKDSYTLPENLRELIKRNGYTIVD